MRPPAPYASCLYGRLVDLRDAAKGSWRGVGTVELHGQIAHLEARIAELELDGPGTAWTVLDEVWWRGAGRGRRVRLDGEHYSWLEAALGAAGVEMPAAFEVGHA